MAIPIVVPQMGESVVEGTIGRWLKAEGERINKDETIVEIMTDKINVEVPAIDSGVLGQIVAREGTVVEIGAEIGYILAEGESLPNEIGGKLHEPVGAHSAAASGGSAGGQSATSAPSRSTDDREARRRTSPVVRRLLREHNLRLDDIPGTGAGGRVTRNDVLTFVHHREETRTTSPTPAVPQRTLDEPVPMPAQPSVAYASHEHLDEEPVETVPFAGVRKVIADHMIHSKQTSAHVMTMDEADLTELVKVREARKNEWREKTGANVTYMPFLIKAAVAALKEFPTINASIEGNSILLKKYYHIGVAVARDEGLIVPVVKHADKKSIVQIAHELGALADRARQDKLDYADITGSTFTITNAGMYGALASTPVINQPEVCILGVHKIQKRPVVKDDQIVIRDMMYLTISFDHRIIDGHTGVMFLRRFIERLEDPYELLLTVG